MTTKYNGGPFHPIERFTDTYDRYTGASLLDFYIAAALTGLLSNENVSKEHHEYIAREAVAFAVATLAERDKT